MSRDFFLKIQFPIKLSALIISSICETRNDMMTNLWQKIPDEPDVTVDESYHIYSFLTEKLGIHNSVKLNLFFTFVK